MPQLPDVDVVVVSWNVREDLVRCIASILDSVDVTPRIVVIDNASADGSADAVAERWPQVTLIRNAANLGFARAVNQGLRAGAAPWVALLNPDTVVPPDALAALVARLRALPGHAMVVPRLVGADGAPQHSVHPPPSLGISLLLATGTQRLIGERLRSRLLLEGSWRSDQERDVPWAIGAAMVVRRSAVERVGPLDESYFVYAEDVEWCDRMRSQGYRIRFSPAVSVTHLGNRSGAQRYGSRRTETYLANTVRFISNRHGRLWTAAWVAVNGAAVVGRLGASAASLRLRPSPWREHMHAYWQDQARYYLALRSGVRTRRGEGEARSLLVLGNNYPPLSLGGYELLCQEHVAWRRRRGDAVTVVTSTHGLDEGSNSVEWGRSGERVVRALDFHWRDFELRPPHGIELITGERRQRRALEHAIATARPDAAVVWHMACMSKSLLACLHAHGIPTMLVIGETWPAWDIDQDGWTKVWSRRPVRPHSRLLKPLVGRAVGRVIAPGDLGPALASVVPVYASDHLRRQIEIARPEWRGRGVVVHNGIDLSVMSRDRDDGAPLRAPVELLYAGRVERRKGVHTAIAVLGGLRREGVVARLSIVGWRDEAYAAELRDQATALGVERQVEWRDAVGREEIADVYRAADVLLFPTMWAEPFGLAPLEAMAAGCVVVATGTGGSGEYLRDGENCLLFPRGDEQAALHAVLRLLKEDGLAPTLRGGGRRTAQAFRFEEYAAALDSVLEKLILDQSSSRR